MCNDLSIKIFSDGANLDEINKLAKNEIISGITTNPTLMRKQELQIIWVSVILLANMLGINPYHLRSSQTR